MPPPDRWEAYSSMGKVIPGTKFIAFKVPLKEALMQNVEDKDRFSPSILMTQLAEQNLTLAGVIDLTFTWKYYNKREFLDKSVGHRKVFTKGHEVPSEEVYIEFSEAVDSFSNDENLIGIHCTHGVNRTGYLICRYMIEKMNMNPQEAINLFNTARGHDIERENYISDLRRRKSESSVESTQGQAMKKKPRWRHHKEDYPNWRQKNHQPPGGSSILPSSAADLDTNWREGKLKVFRQHQNPRFAAPNYPRPRGTYDRHSFQYQNNRYFTPHSYRHGGGGFDGWHSQQWQDIPFYQDHCNGNCNLYYQRQEMLTGRGHWEVSGYYNEEHHRGRRFPGHRFHRPY